MPLHLFWEELRFGSSSAISAAGAASFCLHSDDNGLVFLVLISTRPLDSFSVRFLVTVFLRNDVFVFVVAFLLVAFKSAELEEAGEDKNDLADDPASESRLALCEFPAGIVLSTTAMASTSAYY